MFTQLAGSAWGVISAWLLLLLGALLAVKLCRYFGVPARRSLVLYLWHAMFSLVYAAYVLQFGGDALAYYENGLAGNVEFSLGTAAVSFITVFFASQLGLTFLGACLGFHVFGFIGLLALDGSLRAATSQKSVYVRRAAALLVFLPSISFWSAAVGKDALAFMSAALALWAAIDMQRRSRLLLFSILVMLLVRPHMAVLMVLATVGSLFFRTGMSRRRRALIGVASIGLAVVLVPLAINYAGLQDSSASGFSDYVEKRQQYNMEGGGAIDISSMSLPMKLFTYLFRPLPYEAKSFTALAASLDNVVMLALVFLWAANILVRKSRNDGSNRAFLWLYVGAAWLILGLTTANLGISVRQKWMFAPMLIYLCISMLGKRRPADPGTSGPQSDAQRYFAGSA